MPATAPASNAQRIAAELAESGICVITAAEMFGEVMPLLWYRQLCERASRFAGSRKVRLAQEDYEAGTKRNALKQFLVKHQDRQQFFADDPLLCLGQELLEVASLASGCPLRLYSADLWCVLPHANRRPREWSHNWHRDPECSTLVKATLYLCDVDEHAGPFEYVVGSHRGYPHLCKPGAYVQDQASIEAETPPESRLTVTGPTGTLILANTAGIHRGGYTQGKPRLNAVWTYLPESFPAPNLYEVSAP